jgi:hypothetical protein
MDEQQIAAIQAENEALKIKVAELEARLMEASTGLEDIETATIENEIQAAIEAGKITDIEKPIYQNFGKGNLSGLKDTLKALQPKNRVFTADAKTDTTVKNMTWDYLYRNDAAKLADLKANDFQTFNTIFRTKFGVDYKREGK